MEGYSNRSQHSGWFSQCELHNLEYFFCEVPLLPPTRGENPPQGAEFVSCLNNGQLIFLRPKESIMLSERFLLFSPIELKLFFLCFSDLPNNEMTTN